MSGTTVMVLVLGGCGFLLLACLGLIQWRIGRMQRTVSRARNWPTVPGRIVSGSIAMRSISLPRGRSYTYGANIGYEYEVGGRRYRSDRYSLSGQHQFSFEGRAKRLLAKFPVGTPVTVSYDPAKPEAGVISLSAPAIFVLRFVFWFVLALATWLIGAPLVFEPGIFGREPLVRL